MLLYSSDGLPKFSFKSSVYFKHLCAELQLKLVYFWVLVWVIEANGQEVVEEVFGLTNDVLELRLLALGWVAI